MIELGSIVLGVITCPKCERSGPVNLQIVEKNLLSRTDGKRNLPNFSQLGELPHERP